MKPFEKIPEAPFSRHILLGHTPAFAQGTLNFIQRCQEARLDLVRAKIAFRDFVFLLHPEGVREVLQKNHRGFKKSFAYEGLRHFLGEGLLTSEGDFWLSQRRLMQPSFHAKALQNLQAKMERISRRFAGELARGGYADFSVQQIFLRLTREITSECLFGEGLLDEEATGKMDVALEDLRNYANQRLKNPLMPPRWVPVPANTKFKKANHIAQAVVRDIVSRKQKSQGEELLDTLIQVRDADTGESMPENQIIHEVLTLFIAGQETTTNALTFALYLLAKHPETRARLGEPEYRKAIVQEVLRLYPPAWAVSREAIGDTSVMGFQIPAKTTVFLSIYGMHRHPEYWENPDEFQPERWQGEVNRQAYLPFGFGPRICIGNHFAMMEMEAVLAAFAEALEWEIDGDFEPRLITPMTLNFAAPLQMAFRPANSPVSS